MSKNIIAPPVRFQGFTEPWEQRKLGEIGTTFSGLSGKAKEDFGHGEAQFVTYMNVYLNAVSDSSMTERVEIDDHQNKVQYGDVFFTTSSETPDEVGMSSVWFGSKDNTYLNSFCFGFRPTKEIDPYYMAFMLRSDIIRRKIIILAQGISRYNLSKKQVMKIAVPLPELSEQYKIGAYLQSLDRLITLHQRKLELMKKLKAFFQKNMFPEEGETVPRIRFKEFTGDWEQCKLGDISSVIDPHPSHRAPAETQTGIPFIGIGDVDEAGNVDYSTARIVDEKIYEEHHKRYDLAIPSVGIGRVASLGKVIRLRNDIGKYAVSPTMSIIQFSQEVDVNYMYSCMSSPYFQQQFTAQSSGSTRQSVGIQDLRRFMIPIPQNKIEQINIGMFFWKLDSIITHHQRKIDQLQAVKKFMLQNMFI